MQPAGYFNRLTLTLRGEIEQLYFVVPRHGKRLSIGTECHGIGSHLRTRKFASRSITLDAPEFDAADGRHRCQHGARGAKRQGLRSALVGAIVVGALPVT